MLNPDFAEMLSALSAEGVEFLLVGAYAMAAHGLPRATGDIDIWVRPSPGNAKRVLRALERFGAPTFGVRAADLAKPGKGLTLGRPPNRIDILTEIDGVLFAAAWATRVTITIDKQKLYVLDRATLIMNKRAAGRPKDLLDLAALNQKPRTPATRKPKAASPKPRRARPRN